jgi:hypothetical protein
MPYSCVVPGRFELIRTFDASGEKPENEAVFVFRKSWIV